MNILLKRLLDPHWYLLGVILFSVALALCLYKPLVHFYSLDPLPALKNYPDTTEYTKVQTGLSIKNFGKFDVQKNNFLIDASIWFVYDPKKINDKAIATFNFDQAELLYTSTPYFIAMGEKKMAWYDVRLKFSSNLNYHLFPVDDHYISLELHNKSLIDEHAIYTSAEKNFECQDDMHLQGWEIVGKKVEIGYGQQNLYLDHTLTKIIIPKVAFTLACSRTGVRHLMIIMLPLFVIYCIALISFLLNLETQQEKIIEIISASLAGLIGYRFVLESMSPSVDYFMISDYIYLLFLAALFVLFLLILLHRYIPHWLRSLTILLLHVLIIAVWYYYFNMWLITS
jgi:hypothetical protein